MTHHAADGQVVTGGVRRAASVALEHCIIELLQGSSLEVEECRVQRAPVHLRVAS